MVIPEEGKQVAPVLDAGPFVAAVAPHETLEHPVDRVYRIHRVLAVRKALRLARRVNDSSHSEFLHQQRMASFSVVDHHAASLDVGHQSCPDFVEGRLAESVGDEYGFLPVGRREDAVDVPRKPAKLLPVPEEEIRRGDRKIGLVGVKKLTHHDTVLIVFQCIEDLESPVSACGIGVRVVY